MRRKEAYLLPHLLEDSAQNDPGHIAFVCRDSTITYGELRRRSGSLASALIAAGVKKGDRVGILTGKRIETAGAVYGIMSAGAAYVPLDPTAPASRLNFILRDCGIRVLISEPRRNTLLQRMAEDGAALDLVIAGGGDLPYGSLDWSEIEALDPGAAPGVTESDLCYILYTSGSTGTPKGIAHTHRSALSWANVSAAAYSLTPSDIISNYGPLHFDQSTFDYFSGARAGATTVMITEDRMRLAASLADIIESERMTLFYTVPTVLIQLAAPGILDGRDMSSLKRILFGGEPIPMKHLRTLMETLPHTTFVNIYGPTEVNGVTHHRVGRVPRLEDPPLPIGRPYENVETLVIDEEGVEVSEGEAGELCVRTPTMMVGYWARPDLTECATYQRERPGAPPDIFHKTGDLVHRSADGDLHFHGRKDRQVKSRGFRVELDEIEAALLSHPRVVESAAYEVTNVETGTSIHASVILRDGTNDEEGQVLAHVRRILPPYAVPTSLAIRTEFPRLASGKIDRKTLQTAVAAGEAPG